MLFSSWILVTKGRNAIETANKPSRSDQFEDGQEEMAALAPKSARALKRAITRAIQS